MIALNEIYGDAKYHEFRIRSYSFNLNESDPTVAIKVGHYSLEEVANVTFKGVFYHSAMSESFIFMGDDESWEVNTFISKARNSELIPWLASYTLLGAEHIVELNVLTHYRVHAQDHFIDVVCTKDPIISVEKKTAREMDAG